MGKRSDFKRRPMDTYDTPYSAAPPLLPHLTPATSYYEPCAGRGELIRHLGRHGFTCTHASDVAPRDSAIMMQDAMEVDLSGASLIITNPPWTREILHPMIERFSAFAPTWLLFDADWMHTKQAYPYLEYCHDIVSVGRVKWIEDSNNTGKDNAAWYRFDKTYSGLCRFHGRAK